MGALAGDGTRNQREAPHKRSKGEEPSTSGLGRKKGRAQLCVITTLACAPKGGGRHRCWKGGSCSAN